MGQFASGWKRSYYGKADVIVYRLNRGGKTAAGGSPVFGASITILVYGDAFWQTYATGDNTGLIATDSMKNFVQREVLNYQGPDLEDCCRFLGAKFLDICTPSTCGYMSRNFAPRNRQQSSRSGPW